MCTTTFAALLGLAATCAGDLGPTDLLAPADPSRASHWRPPASPVAGLRAYAPVDPKDWLQDNKAVTGGGMNMKGMDMKSMPGMQMKGMGR